MPKVMLQFTKEKNKEKKRYLFAVQQNSKMGR